MSFELYRQTKLGDCLCETLMQFCEDQKISTDLAKAVFNHFDESILKALKEQVKSKALIKAKLKQYRYFDSVWQFHLEDVSFRMTAGGTGSAANAPELTCEKAKLVCVDSKIIDT